MTKDEIVHYYNVITGRIVCGTDITKTNEMNFSVFRHKVSCPCCLESKPSNVSAAKGEAA